MKKIKIVLLMIVAVIFILPSCKKGENDPFLSLKTRKARITGEWTLKEGTSTGTSVNGSTTSTHTSTYTSSTCTSSSSGTSTTTPYTEKLTIDKDGTFKWEINDNGDMDTYEGAWYFGRKNKELDIKTKETVCLAITKDTYLSGGTTTIDTYTGTNAIAYPVVLQIDMLKNKEMTVKMDGTYNSTGGSTIYSGTDKGTKTYEQ